MTAPDRIAEPRPDGLHCVHGKCRGWPNSTWPCHPGCSFHGSAISELELIRRSIQGADWLAQEIVREEAECRRIAKRDGIPRPWWKPPRNDFLSWATYWWPAWFALGFVILSWLLRS